MIQIIKLGLPFSDRLDEIKWQEQDSKKLKNIKIYKWLMFRGIEDKSKNLIWKLKIPHKIKIFLWLLSKRKILVKANLEARGWQGDTQCVYYHHKQTVDHLFIGCKHVKQLCVQIIKAFGISGLPRSLEGLSNIFLSLKDNRRSLLGIISAALMWTCWLEMNMCCFSRSRPISQQSYKAKIYVLLLYWAGAWKEAFKVDMEEVLQASGIKAGTLDIIDLKQRSTGTQEAQEHEDGLERYTEVQDMVANKLFYQARGRGFSKATTVN